MTYINILALLSVAVLCSWAKLSKIPKLSFNPIDEPDVLLDVEDTGDELSADLRVVDLNLDSFDSLRYKVGTWRQEDEFEEVFGALIESLEHHQNDPHKLSKDEISVKDAPTKGADADHDQDDKQIKQEIRRIINKFLLSIYVEPHSYLTDIEHASTPSISLLFKGRYTSIKINYGQNQWHYFISPPSPLPAWFYENHLKAGPAISIEVPKHVEKDFYKAILHLLRLFLSFAL